MMNDRSNYQQLVTATSEPSLKHHQRDYYPPLSLLVLIIFTNIITVIIREQVLQRNIYWRTLSEIALTPSPYLWKPVVKLSKKVTVQLFGRGRPPPSTLNIETNCWIISRLGYPHLKKVAVQL